MTHFRALVLVPVDQARHAGDLRAALSEMLEPFNENTQVDSYDRACYCKGLAACTRAREITEEMMPLASLREGHRIVCEERLATKDAETACTESQDLWRETIKPYEALYEQTLAAQPDKDAPDPACEDCGGSGTMSTQYNPRSQWDWWVIGGRWHGALCSSYADAPEGYRVATPWPPLLKILDEGGLGADGYNVALVEQLGDFRPHALCYPGPSGDPLWLEKGQMGWWGMQLSTNETYAAEYAETLSAFGRTHVAVLVDCHI